jgi:hypothetical protein
MDSSYSIQETTNTKPELALIKSKIYELRGVKVMLDFDLAKAYEIETKVLKQSVRRNIIRFEGDDFMFELTKNEIIELSRSQSVTLNNVRGSNIKYSPFAFTELGIAMLSSILNSEKAIEINKHIMRTFVALRQYALGYTELNQKLESFMIETHAQFNEIYALLDEFSKQKMEYEKPQNKIGFVLR